MIRKYVKIRFPNNFTIKFRLYIFSFKIILMWIDKSYKIFLDDSVINVSYNQRQL